MVRCKKLVWNRLVWACREGRTCFVVDLVPRGLVGKVSLSKKSTSI